MAKSKEKTKKKPSAASGDNFLVLHGEKFLFVLVLLLTLWLMTKGSGLTPFTLTPDQIHDAVSKAENRIKTNDVPLEEVDKDLNVTNYLGYASLIKSSLKSDYYKTDIRWEQSLFPEKILRPDVVPMTVENLRAVACVGAIRYAKGQGAAAMAGMNAQSVDDRGRHWITVTGLIPIAEQLKEYNEELGRAQFTDYNRDVPKYVFYDIFRGVVDENGETRWDENPIDLSRVYADEIDQWISYGFDPVSPDYIVPIFSINSPSLTMECPPMVNKPFGAEVTNLPNIPLLSETQKEQLAEYAKETQEYEKELKSQSSRDFGAALNQSIFSGLQTGGTRSGAGPMGAGPMGMAGPPGMSGPPGMMGPPGTMGNQRGLGMTRAPGMSGPSSIKETSVDYYLFRFFDFSVQEGVTYRYKVKLYLANPNYGLDINLVEDGDSVTRPTIVSEESGPSNPVSLGSESRILVESIEPAGRPGQDPKMTIASIYFNTEDAKESIAPGKKVVRGQVANFLREQHRPIDMGGTGVMSGNMSDTGRRPERVYVNHESDICILDAEGGEKIGGTELRAPAKMLVMNPSGLVTVHDETADKSELAPYLNPSGGR